MTPPQKHLEYERHQALCAALEGLLGQVLRTQGKLLGKMEVLGFGLRNEARVRSLTTEWHCALAEYDLFDLALRYQAACRPGVRALL